MLRREVNTILSSSSNLHIVIIGLVKGPALKDETIRENLWKGECTVHLLHVSGFIVPYHLVSFYLKR